MISLKNGKKQNALMMCNTIVSSFPYSAYDYASYKNLVSIYYDLNDYIKTNLKYERNKRTD